MKIRLSDWIESVMNLPFLPIVLAEHHPRKAVRVLGVVLYVVWAVPVFLLAIVIGGLLSIPALIQDA